MRKTIFISLVLALSPSMLQADIVEFTNAQLWQNAVGGQYSTIDFTGFPDGTPINNQYRELGITFLPPAFIFVTAFALNDNCGLHGPAGIRFTFDAPQNWVAIDYPGTAKFDLYNEGQLIYTSSFFFQGGVGNFAGLVSSLPFDEVYIYRPPPNDGIFIDDLHWGAAVPAPGALALMVLTLIYSRRRRT